MELDKELLSKEIKKENEKTKTFVFTMLAFVVSPLISNVITIYDDYLIILYFDFLRYLMIFPPFIYIIGFSIAAFLLSYKGKSYCAKHFFLPMVVIPLGFLAATAISEFLADKLGECLSAILFSMISLILGICSNAPSTAFLIATNIGTETAFGKTIGSVLIYSVPVFSGIMFLIGSILNKRKNQKK